MISVSKHILSQLSAVLAEMTNDEYILPIELFSGASVSQHTRHILEFYICLLDQQGDAINYDARKRDQRLEQNISFTLETITSIIHKLPELETKKPVTLCAIQGGQEIQVPSSLERELLYAIEHTVHHMAIIKMGLLMHFPQVAIPASFGVAESTIQYRNQCAQ